MTDAPPLAGSDVIEEVLALVRQHGGRATSARRLLLGALTAPGHHSADELATAIQAQAPEVNRSTIYRNLDELERLNIVEKTHLGGGAATYHLTLTAHGHLVCGQCGTMTEVPSELFSALAQAAQDRYGFTIQPGRFAVIGQCADCKTASKVPSGIGGAARRCGPAQARSGDLRTGR